MKNGLFFIFLPLLTNAQYRIEELNNPLLPISQGTSYIVISNYHIYYHINLTNIKECLRTTEKTLLQTNKTLDNSNKPLYNLLKIRINDLFDQVNSIKSFVNHYTTPSNRSKRGLFNFLGKAHKYLYGTLDADDGDRYDKYINILHENQLTIDKDITATQTIVKQLTEDVDSKLSDIKINQQNIQIKINELSRMTQSTGTTLYVITLLDNIENNLRVLNEIKSNVQTAISFAEINIMHHSIFKYQELQSIISKLEQRNRIPFDNIIKYYEVAYTDVTIKKDLVIFYIAIPLISGNPYEFYQLYPIPVNNQLMTLKNRYLLKSLNDFFNSKENCQKIEEITLCQASQLNRNEPCVLQTMNLTSHCPMMFVKYEKTSITQLRDNSVIIIPTSPENIYFQCPNQNTIEKISQASLILPAECTIKIKDNHYDSQRPNTVNLRLKLPSINIDENLIKNTEPLLLKEINLENIHNDIDLAKKLIVHPLKNIDVETTSVSVFTTLLIILVILGIIVLTYYYCRKPKKDVKVDIQLKPLENETPFSQS